MVAGKRHPAAGRRLLAWEWGNSYEHEFTAVNPFVSSLCVDTFNDYFKDPTRPADETYLPLRSGFGQAQGNWNIYDGGVCDQRNTKWVSFTPLSLHASVCRVQGWTLNPNPNPTP